MSDKRPADDKQTQMLSVIVHAAVYHAVEACVSATGQRRTIELFVNKTHIANEVLEVFREAAKEARNG